MTPDGSPAPVSRLVAGVASLAAVVLVGGVVVSARGVDPADRPTTVSAGAVVRTGSGSHPSRAGETVPRGAEVTTASGATLSTGGRQVRLAPGTAVTVQDGVRQRVSRGSVLVAVRRGPALRLSSTGADLRVAGRDAVARLDTGSVLRATSYAGRAAVTVPGRGVTTTVGRLYRLEIALGSAPGAAVPLHLTAGDAWEATFLREVVTDDEELGRFAAEFAAPGSALAAALPGRLRLPGDRVATAERAVAFALAAGREDQTFRDVLAYRGLGGSWGVVAALVRSDSGVAAGVVDALGGPDTSQVLAASAPDGLAVLPALPGPGSGDAPAPTVPSPSAPGSPGPTPSASPAPSAGPLPEPAGSVLAPVLDLLPVEVPLLSSPSPSPSASRAPRLPVVGPVVDGLLRPSP